MTDGFQRVRVSRRSFLGTAFAAIALGCRQMPVMSAMHRSDYNGIGIGAISYSWWGWDAKARAPLFAGIERVINSAQDAGLGTLELMGEDIEVSLGVEVPRPKTALARAATLRQRMLVSDSALIALRERLMASGLNVHLIKFGSIGDSEMSTWENDYFCRVARFLGAPAVSREVPIATSERFEEFEKPGMKLDVDTIKRCAKIADRNNVRIAFHNHMQINTVTYDDPVFSLSPNLTINFDIGHFVAANETNAMSFVRKYKDRIYSIHLKDRTLPSHGSKNVCWGEGDTPLRELFRYMCENSWSPFCDIELEYSVPPGSSVTREIGVCNRYCKKLIEQVGRLS